MIPIANLDFYNKEMDKGTKEKLWFLNELPEEPSLVIDYGCATGAQLSALHELIDAELVGLDVDQEMLDRAVLRSPMTPILVDPYCIRYWPNKHPSVLVLSSVIHEIYSYCALNQVRHFWEWVRTAGFDYICIRDMALTREDSMKTVPQNDTAKIEEHADRTQLQDFLDHWGDINLNLQTCLHYLFKYRYTLNWDREVVENYFPIYYGIAQQQLSSYYDVLVDKHEIFEYNRDVIQQDFGITVDVPTHYKLLLRIKSDVRRLSVIA